MAGSRKSSPVSSELLARPRLRGLWISAALLSVAIVAAASWWFVGTRAWTNGDDVSVVDREARLREVLWKPPVPLDENFNTVDQEYEPTVSPDSTEIYFVRGKAGKERAGQADIFVSYRRNNAWSKPTPVEGVNSEYDDLGPRLAADGKYLFFYSNRPGGFGEYDIWASPRTADGWGKPFNLGPNVNSEFNEYSPSPTPDGKRLIFSTNRKSASLEQKENWRATIRQNGVGDYDLFVAQLDDSSDPSAVFLPATQPALVTQVSESAVANDVVENLAPTTSPTAGPTTAPTTAPTQEPPALAFKPATEIAGVNTPFHEGASCLSPFGDFLYFSSNRPGGEGKFDLYRARVQPDGSFADVENLGKQINTPDNETDPQLAMGGFHLLFSSDRAGSQGGYDLLASDSVEVFSKRQGHPLPQLGWSWWVLLGSLVALVPLLMLLRGWNDHRLNVLQKCLLVSVVLHVLLTIALSFVFVSQEVIHYARKELGMEVAVSLDVPVEQAIGMSIRSQAGSSDLPVGDGLAAPAPTQQVNAGTSQSNADLPEAFDVGLPNSGAAPAPGEMTVMVRAPQVTVPTPGHPVEVSVAAVSPDAIGKAPAIEIAPAAVRVSQAERRVETVTPNVEITRATGIGEKIAAAAAEPMEVAVGKTEPAAQESIAQAAVTNPRSASAMVAPEAVRSPAAPAAPQQQTALDVTGPMIGQTQKVASTGAEAPTIADQAIEASRQGGSPTDEATLAARPAGTSDTKIPAADIAMKSTLADASVGTAAPRLSPLDQVALGPAVKVPVDAANTGGGPTITGPRKTIAPLASGLPDAPKVEETAIGTIRQGVAGGSAGKAGDGALEAALAAGADKGLAPTQQGSATSMAQSSGSAARVASGAAKMSGPAVAVAAPRGVTGGSAGVEVGSAIKSSAAKVSGPDGGPMSPADLKGTGPVVRASTGNAATVGAGSAQTTDLTIGASRPTTQPSTVVDANVTGGAGSRIGVIAPTAMVKPKVQTALAGGSNNDDLGAGLMATKLGRVGAESADAASPSVETSFASARIKGTDSGAAGGGSSAAAQLTSAAPAAGGATAGTEQSLALSAGAGPRKVMSTAAAGGTTAAPNLAGGIVGPELAGPKIGASARAGKVGGPDLEAMGPAGGMREPSGSIVSKAGGGKGGTGLGAMGPGGINVGTDVVRPISPGGPGTGPIALGSSTGGVRVRGPAIDSIDGPKVSIAKPRLAAPEAMFQRSVEVRKPVLEKMGGNQKSEEAVDRALGYLARNQEPDGRWTLVNGDGKPGQRGESSPHDTATTGLALLAFLANDHTPVDPGPYRDVVANGVKWLIKTQEATGDLRGKHKGGGADQGNLYDQGIATFALAEAALMTSDPEITAAAFRGADFIVKSQHKETGGWRYSPGESGDTSVFGWQVMALHSAELAGYKIPPDCKAGMLKYIEITSQGQHKGLGGYQPGGGATAPMTAELLFCRIMLGQEISSAAEKEVGEFLTQRLAEQGSADFYCWYYTSLSLIQLQNDSWRKWNEKARDTLISMQVKGGNNDGVWDTGLWRDRGGRIFSTSLGALTLQVYYRYAPLRATEKNAAKP